MLYRYAKLLKLDTAASDRVLSRFSDGGKSHDWAAEGLAWCVENQIIQGRNGGILDPGNNVTRAETAVMLQRFLKLIR